MEKGGMGLEVAADHLQLQTIRICHMSRVNVGIRGIFTVLQDLSTPTLTSSPLRDSSLPLGNRVFISLCIFLGECEDGNY